MSDLGRAVLARLAAWWRQWRAFTPRYEAVLKARTWYSPGEWRVRHIGRFWSSWVSCCFGAGDSAPCPWSGTKAQAHQFAHELNHPRCKRDFECLLDNGHAGECDPDQYL